MVTMLWLYYYSSTYLMFKLQNYPQVRNELFTSLLENHQPMRVKAGSGKAQ